MPDIPKWSWSSKTETGMKNHHIQEEGVVWCSEAEEGLEVKSWGNPDGAQALVAGIILRPIA